MKETNLLEALLLLMVNHFNEEVSPDAQQLKAELEEAGIPVGGLIKIVNWLKNLFHNNQLPEQVKSTTRIFSKEECDKLDITARSCILFLEQAGALSETRREWLIEQAMELDMDTVSLDELNGLLSLLLFQQYGQANLLTHHRKSLIITNPATAH
jgi:Smg protein